MLGYLMFHFNLTKLFQQTVMFNHQTKSELEFKINKYMLSTQQ